MNMGKKIGLIVLIILVVLLILAAMNWKAVRMIWNSVAARQLPMDESADWTGGASYEYVPYSDASNADWLHLYVPESSEPMPLAIMVHGGGFILGDADSEQSQRVYRYFRDHGYAAASVNYRLADEAEYPAAIEDVKAAVRFLRANAARYGYDPDRFVILGESAGGYLATMAAVTSDEEFMGTPFIGEDAQEPISAKVSALVDFYGIMDFCMEDADWKADGLPKLVVNLANSWMLGHTGKFSSWMDCWIGRKVIQAQSLETADAEMKPYLPSTYIAKNFTPDSGFRAIILHGDADITVSMQNSVRLYEAFCGAIGEEKTQFVLYPGYGHAADLFFSEEHMDDIRAYLDQAL